MPSKHYDAAHQWQSLHTPSLKSAHLDYKVLLMKKMSELNSSTNNHQLATGMAAYENFCASDNVMPINSTKQSSFDQLRSRQMNGGDSPLSPSSPISWQDHQQHVRSLVQELEERKRNEEQLQHIIKVLNQRQLILNGGDFDQGNGPSLTPDGLPAAPSSDGLLESVKDGHIRRLGRDLTMLKAKLHETEASLSTAQRERDSAFQQVASFTALLADSDRRATNLQHQLSAVTSARGAEKMAILNAMLEKQKAEISTLKESVQRLNRENQSLKENAAILSSRQPSSLGNSGGSTSVAGCSQELDYLHKVVDTLKATVQEQHAKLCSLRPLQDKASQALSIMSGSIKAQSFPVTSSSSASRAATASLARSVRRPAVKGAVVTLDNSEWSVDGIKDLPSSTTTAVPSTTTVTLNNNLGGPSNMNASSRSNQAVQDDETVNSLGNMMQKFKLVDSKPIPGVSGDRMDSEGKQGENGIDAVDNPSYFLTAPQNNFNQSSESKFKTASSDKFALGVLNPTASGSKSQSQVIASCRSDFHTAAAAAVPTSSGTRPLSRSEVIGVNSGLVRPSISRSSSAHVSSGALPKEASIQDLLAALGGKSVSPLNPAATTTLVTGSVPTPELLPSRFPLMTGMVGCEASSSAQQLPRHAQPQFQFEAEIDEGCSTHPVAVDTNFQHQAMSGYHQQRLPVSSSVFSPQPPPPHQKSTSSPSPLSTYQTASTAVTSDRDGMHVLNKHMMGGGNVIYKQNPQLMQTQQIPFVVGSLQPPISQHLTFTAQAPPSHGIQLPQEKLQYPTNVSPPLGNQQAVYSNSSQQGQAQPLDPSGPRVHSDRACPVCGQDFSHVPMEDFQAHVYECFDEEGPETMKAPGEERSANIGVGGSDRTCPVCNERFEISVPQAEYERHVHNHFGEENFEIVS